MEGHRVSAANAQRPSVAAGPGSFALNSVTSEFHDDEEPQAASSASWSLHYLDPRTTSQIRQSRVNLNRRYVFLCPTSLSKHFDMLPQQAKDSALLVFQCSRDWMFQESSKARRARSEARVDSGVSPGHRLRVSPDTSLSPRNPTSTPSSPSAGTFRSALYRPNFPKEFLQWVVTKDKEDCVYWHKPEMDLLKLSRFFEEKINPATEQPYRPLLLDPQWWRVRFLRNNARYVANAAPVIATISEASRAGLGDSRGAGAVDVPGLQELIYQSNPTLEPVIRWPCSPSVRYVPLSSGLGEGPSSPRRSGKPAGIILRGRFRGPETARLGQWPEQRGGRMDQLYTSWQAEECAASRHQAFASTGMSCVMGGPLSAR
ncbi:unnamed protein product [Prorocentrum cordatum]|uniref:Uncharacterized protein n=1 Tax=Prorocentrum cordatum TaxID=2364126 RepID=A0ABN9TJ00_9DINO|nr:unnamed protein product [Polarella glacialis]